MFWVYNIEGFDEVTIPDEVTEVILNGMTISESASKSESTMQELWESGHYVISRQSHTFLVQLGNNCTHNSQNCTRLCLVQLFPNFTQPCVITDTNYLQLKARHTSFNPSSQQNISLN